MLQDIMELIIITLFLFSLENRIPYDSQPFEINPIILIKGFLKYYEFYELNQAH